jgi:O-antigen/teichoic acid export membrane protein
MMGIYFNLSFWYKLIDKTIWGAIFSGIGCAALFAVNILFVPKYGYVACAWGGFAGYGIAMVLSYIVGQRYNPIKYPLRDIFVYVLLTAVLFIGIHFSSANLPLWASLIVNTILVGVFVAYTVKRDFPLKNLPYVGKYFK